MEQTTNYQLSQWEGEDRILREDFNADNAKVDAALKAEAEARAALAGQVAKLGNCRIWTTTYKGSGGVGKDNPTRITFPKKPLLAMVNPFGSTQIAWLTPYDGCLIFDRPNQLSWSGNTASWYASYSSMVAQDQLNYAGGDYFVVAFIAADS